MKNKTYKMLGDAGHAWLSVKKKDIEELGMADRITEYSYVKGASVYLEEDLDVGTFIRCYLAKFGKPPAIENGKRYDDKPHPIRGYERYTYQGAVAEPVYVYVDCNQRSDYLQVKKTMLEELHMTSQVTSGSYEDADHVYLCAADAALFKDAYMYQHAKLPNVQHAANAAEFSVENYQQVVAQED